MQKWTKVALRNLPHRRESWSGGNDRLCMLTGTTPALTNAEMTPDHGYLEEHSLFELLDRARVRWRYYEGDIGFIRVLEPYRVDFTRVRPLEEFLEGGRSPLPPVTFIDPNVKEAPSEDPASDDHAPTPVCRGQQLLARIQQRVWDSTSWSRTLLVITYDEHGGFYDHVPPPGTDRFAGDNPTVGANFPRVHPDVANYGVRVPALVVSPLILEGRVGNKIYDHTSITRTILQRFVPTLVGHMPERVRRARHFGELLELEPRASIPSPHEIRTPDCDDTGMRFSRPGSAVRYEGVRTDVDDERVQLQLLGVPTG